MNDIFRPTVDRAATLSVTQQIYRGLRDAIRNGALPHNGRLASWQDLSCQLGVSRGTVKRAYDLLKDESLIETRGSGGTWVIANSQFAPDTQPNTGTNIPGLFYDFEAPPQYFQLGVPAQDAFPSKAWHTAWRHAVAGEVTGPQIYPDPRGLMSLRREIAGYLATARGVVCHPDQVFVTAGFAGALGVVLNAMGFHGEPVLMEDPGFPRTREALERFGMETVPVPVDHDGMCLPAHSDIAGVRVAVVTPGQQAPLGMALSPARRSRLLDWATKSDGWIIEDDYTGELQLSGHARPSLAASDLNGRVFHIGSFSKTLSPGLKLGYLVVPQQLLATFASFVAHLAPAGSNVTQRAVQSFMSGGHYLRHLRRMKALYSQRKALLVSVLRDELHPAIKCEFDGALSVRLFFPANTDDVQIARRSRGEGLGAIPISAWYQTPNPPCGLVLGISNVNAKTVRQHCKQLARIIGRD